MSLKALPILYINLGGEMIYILDQRLRAQNIKDDTSTKVIKDIIATMFESNVVGKLFEPSPLHSIESLKSLFDKLAHSSVMKLNDHSMTKLYELMIMAVKFEVLNSPRPKDILSVTLNHLDEMCHMVGEDDRAIINLLENVYQHFHKTYGKLSHGSYMRIQNCILTFFQDTNIRVSAYLNDKLQKNDGKLVIKIDGLIGFDIDLPGKIKYYHKTGELTQIKKFDCGAGPYMESITEGSFDRFGKRGVMLGKNIYTNSLSSSMSDPPSHSSKAKSNDNSDQHARAQLDFLTNLIGRKQANKMKTEFNFNLFNSFNNDDEFGFKDNEATQEETNPKAKSNIVYVDAKKKKVPTATLR